MDYLKNTLCEKCENQGETKRDDVIYCLNCAMEKVSGNYEVLQDYSKPQNCVGCKNTQELNINLKDNAIVCNDCVLKYEGFN